MKGLLPATALHCSDPSSLPGTEPRQRFGSAEIQIHIPQPVVFDRFLRQHRETQELLCRTTRRHTTGGPAPSCRRPFAAEARSYGRDPPTHHRRGAPWPPRSRRPPHPAAVPRAANGWARRNGTRSGGRDHLITAHQASEDCAGCVAVISDANQSSERHGERSQVPPRSSQGGSLHRPSSASFSRADFVMRQVVPGSSGRDFAGGSRPPSALMQKVRHSRPSFDLPGERRAVTRICNYVPGTH